MEKGKVVQGKNGNDPKDDRVPDQEYFTVGEVAKILRISRQTIVQRFSGLRGVIDLGYPERMHKKKYSILRIPHDVLNRFIAEHSSK